MVVHEILESIETDVLTEEEEEDEEDPPPKATTKRSLWFRPMIFIHKKLLTIGHQQQKPTRKWHNIDIFLYGCVPIYVLFLFIKSKVMTDWRMRRNNEKKPHIGGKAHGTNQSSTS